MCKAGEKAATVTWIDEVMNWWIDELMKWFINWFFFWPYMPSTFRRRQTFKKSNQRSRGSPMSLPSPLHSAHHFSHHFPANAEPCLALPRRFPCQTSLVKTTCDAHTHTHTHIYIYDTVKTKPQHISRKKRELDIWSKVAKLVNCHVILCGQRKFLPGTRVTITCQNKNVILQFLRMSEKNGFDCLAVFIASSGVSVCCLPFELIRLQWIDFVVYLLS